MTACGLLLLLTAVLAQVVERLLRPAAKVPTNSWETFMSCLSDGDAKGCWMVVSGKAALFSAPVVLAALVSHLATGGPGGQGEGSSW